MALTTKQRMSAKNLSYDEAKALKEEYTELKQAIDEALERIRKERGLDIAVDKRLNDIKELFNINTDRKGKTYGDDFGVKYSASSVKNSMPAEACNRFIEEDPDEFYRRGGKTTIQQGSFLGFYEI